MIHNHCKEDIIKQRIDNVLDIDTMRDAEDDLKNIDPLFPLNLRNLQDCICPECLFKAPSIDVLQKHMQKVFITELCGGKIGAKYLICLLYFQSKYRKSSSRKAF